MDCEIPEEIVSLKESEYESFKDICIAGDQVSSLNKCPMMDCELDHNNISNLLVYELDKSSTTKVSEAVNKLMEDKAEAGASDAIADAYSAKKIIPEGQIFACQVMNNFASSQFFHSNEVKDEPIFYQDQSTETNMEESSYRRNGFGVKLRKGRIKHGSDSLLSMILREKNKESAGVRNMREYTDDIIKGSPVASLSRQSTLGFPDHGSSSFSSSSPPYGLSALSGSIPYSDSISTRSNSTTSNRSFAFPRLAGELYDSPVRMAEAERLRSKKPRCWPMCFSC